MLFILAAPILAQLRATINQASSATTSSTSTSASSPEMKLIEEMMTSSSHISIAAVSVATRILRVSIDELIQLTQLVSCMAAQIPFGELIVVVVVVVVVVVD